MNDNEKDIAYAKDDIIPMGTPIYVSPIGGGMVRLPITKEQDIKYRQQIEELKRKIEGYEIYIEHLKKYLKRKYRKKLKKQEWI